MRKLRSLVSMILIITLSYAYGQLSVNITSCIDNTIYEESNDLSNGEGDFIIVGRTGAANNYKIRRGLIMTEFNFIPSSATITGVELRIIGNAGGPQTVKLHRINKPWGEGLSDATGNEFQGAPATVGDATWNQSKYSSVFWNSLGGDFEAIPSSSATVKAGVQSVFTGSQMIADVQGWLQGTSPDYGWMMIGNEVTPGSVVSLQSGDILSGIPYINVKFKLPPRQVLINEINPSAKWVEFYNPGPVPIDVSDWYLCNAVACDQIMGPEINIVSGSMTIPVGGYLQLEWSKIIDGSGDLSVMKSIAFNYAEVLEDYVQYGAPNQNKSALAVVAGVWDAAASFVPLPSNNMNSLALKNNTTNNGEYTDVNTWEEQSPTPGSANICETYLNLTGAIPLGIYTAVDIDFNGIAQTGSAVGLHFSNSVEFKKFSEVPSNTVMQVIQRDCSN